MSRYCKCFMKVGWGGPLLERLPGCIPPVYVANLWCLELFGDSSDGA